MKYTLSVIIFFFSLLHISGQENRDDELGELSDKFQILFFNALEQKAIENYEKAIEFLEECNTISSNNAAVNFELGKNYYEIDNLNLAEKTLQKANVLKPNNIWILESLYKLYNTLQNKEKVIETLVNLKKTNPKYEDTLLQFYVNVGENKKAINLINTLDKNGYNQERENIRYQIYSNSENFQEQIKFIENKISKNTANENDFVRLIYTYSKTKKETKSYETALLFSKIYPISDMPYLSLYKFYISKNDIDNTTKSMFRVLESNTLKDSYKSKVINDFLNYTKSNNQYLPQLEKATSLFSTIEIESKMALLYNQNNNKKGNKYIESITKNNATSFEDLKLLGSVFLKENRYQDALENSEKALSLYPAQPIFYLQQGKAYNKNNQPKKAIESLIFGLDYLLDNPKMESEFYFEIAKGYELLNNKIKQNNYLKKAKNLSK